jgi:hypothetical protein
VPASRTGRPNRLGKVPPDAAALVSKAWLRHGPKGMFGSVDPGLLIGRDGRVAFTTTKKETVFDADVHEVRANWPWWEFGGGVHITVAGQIYRLSLVRPPNAEDVELEGSGGLGAALAGVDETGITSIGEALAAGDDWKIYLAAQGG